MNYIVAGAASSAFTAIVGYVIYKRRTAVDTQAKRDGAELDLHVREETMNMQARQAALDALKLPMEIMQKQLDKRESELSELRATDKAERQQYIETLQGIRSAVEAIAKDLTAHRDEERASSALFTGSLQELDSRLKVIETQLNIKKPS